MKFHWLKKAKRSTGQLKCGALLHEHVCCFSDAHALPGALTCPFPKDPQFQHSTDSSLHIAGEPRLAQVKSKYCQEGLGVSTVRDNVLPSRTSASHLSLVGAVVSSVGFNSSCPREDGFSNMLSAGSSTFSF